VAKTREGRGGTTNAQVRNIEGVWKAAERESGEEE